MESRYDWIVTIFWQCLVVFLLILCCFLFVLGLIFLLISITGFFDVFYLILKD